MAGSTAAFVAYDVRPAKQTERRGILELLGCARGAGFDIPRYRYVGLGGTKFVDFRMMKRHVGFAEYVSVERDKDIFARCKFNRPYHDIAMYKGDITEFLSVDSFYGNSVYWIDLEIGVGKELFEVAYALAEKAADGDVLLITISGELPAGTRSKGESERKSILVSRLPSLKAQIKRLPNKAFSEKRYPGTASRILGYILTSAFSTRLHEGVYAPLIRVIYKDSTYMCTIGGVFTKRGSRRRGAISKAVAEKIPLMCPPRKAEPYLIPDFNYTDLERILIDKSVPSAGSGYTRRLVTLGLPLESLLEYEEVARYLPRYVEAAF